MGFSLALVDTLFILWSSLSPFSNLQPDDEWHLFPLEKEELHTGAFKNGVGQSYTMILSYSLLLSYDLTIYLITTYFLMIFLCDWVMPLPPLHYAGWGDFFYPCLIISKLFFDTISIPGRILVDSPAYIWEHKWTGSFSFFNWFILQIYPLCRKKQFKRIGHNDNDTLVLRFSKLLVWLHPALGGFILVEFDNKDFLSLEFKMVDCFARIGGLCFSKGFITWPISITVVYFHIVFSLETL